MAKYFVIILSVAFWKLSRKVSKNQHPRGRNKMLSNFVVIFFFAFYYSRVPNPQNKNFRVNLICQPLKQNRQRFHVASPFSPQPSA